MEDAVLLGSPAAAKSQAGHTPARSKRSPGGQGGQPVLPHNARVPTVEELLELLVLMDAECGAEVGFLHFKGCYGGKRGLERLLGLLTLQFGVARTLACVQKPLPALHRLGR
jgi:hypothetical protein